MDSKLDKNRRCFIIGVAIGITIISSIPLVTLRFKSS